VSTWRQLKKLTREVEGLLLSIGQDFIRDCFLAIQANSPIAVKACVPYLYAYCQIILRVKITNLDKSFHIHCNSCHLTNCVDPNLNKESIVMILFKRSAYALLPVELKNDPWFKNSKLQTLKSKRTYWT
jgi:hypothetical protein